MIPFRPSFWRQVLTPLHLFAAVLVLAGCGSRHAPVPYDLDMEKVRALADAPADVRPLAVHYEVVAEVELPEGLTESWLDNPTLRGLVVKIRDLFTTARLPVAVFQIRMPNGTIMVDSGLDKRLGQETYGRIGSDFQRFSPDRFQSVLAALRAADKIVLSHAHPDHAGGVACHSEGIDVINRLVLTRKQAKALRDYPIKGCPFVAGASVTPVDVPPAKGIAPGVVLIPAEGHSPGSIMVFVKLGSGDEILLVGDVAWVMENIQDERGKSNIVGRIMEPDEKRPEVQGQLIDLNRLLGTPGAPHLVPSHDLERLEELRTRGILSRGLATAGT